MVTAVNSTDPFAALGGAGARNTPQTANEAGSAERFLKLLVTQMQNQDPLNPMDNAQLTSQMAQINTVSGIEKLNTTVQGLNGQFVAMMSLQGASLVGRDITLRGDRMLVEGGKAVGGLELAGRADNVRVEVLSPAGRVLDTVNLGALEAGRHGFEWPANAPDGTPYRFRVAATLQGAAVAAEPVMRERVESVSTGSAGLELHTRGSGTVPYERIVAVGMP